MSCLRIKNAVQFQQHNKLSPHAQCVKSSENREFQHRFACVDSHEEETEMNVATVFEGILKIPTTEL